MSPSSRSGGVEFRDAVRTDGRCCARKIDETSVARSNRRSDHARHWWRGRVEVNGGSKAVAGSAADRGLSVREKGGHLIAWWARRSRRFVGGRGRAFPSLRFAASISAANGGPPRPPVAGRSGSSSRGRILQLFDDWRRAVGVPPPEAASAGTRKLSLARTSSASSRGSSRSEDRRSRAASGKRDRRGRSGAGSHRRRRLKARGDGVRR